MRFILLLYFVLTTVCVQNVPGYLGPQDSTSSNRPGQAPWIFIKDNIRFYRFAVFNLIPQLLPASTLNSMLDAQRANSLTNLAADYGVAAEFTVCSNEDLTNPAVFSGTYVPFFIGNFTDIQTFLGMHSNSFVDGTGPDTGIINVNDAIKENLGITVPINPVDIPYAAISLVFIQQTLQRLVTAQNPNRPSDIYQFLSYAFSHEVNEVMVNDVIVTYISIDHTAPVAATWKIAILDDQGQVTNAVGTNGDGTINLPSLTSVYPSFIYSTVKEIGDAVSWSGAILYNGYWVNRWLMSNYPLPAFWRPFFTHNQQYDKMGNTILPLDPRGGVHEVGIFVDAATGKSYMTSVINRGPTLPSQTGFPEQPIWNVNVPPFTSYMVFFPTSAISSSFKLDEAIKIKDM